MHGRFYTILPRCRSLEYQRGCVGTPAWLGDPARGNHNWVELWDGAAWRFWEGRPAGGGETLTNPCDKWFCKAARFPVNG